MSRVLLYLVCIVIFNSVFAQSGKVRAAKKALESGEISLAIESIEEAVAHPKTAEDAEAWYQYFLIQHTLHGTSQSLSERIAIIDKLNLAYSKCIEYDEDYLYSADLTPMITRTFKDYEKQADESLEQKNIEHYILKQEAYLKIGKVLQADLGKDYFEIARICEEQQKYGKADRYYRQSIQADYQVPEAHLSLYRIYKEEDQPVRADSVLRWAFEKYPNRLIIANAIIQESIDGKMYFMARTLANRAIGYNPNEPELHYKLGLINKNLDLPEDAVRSFSKALSLDSEFYKAAYEVGSYYANVGLQENNDRILNVARKYLEECEGKLSDNNKVLVLLRELYLQLRDFENYERVNNLLED